MRVLVELKDFNIGGMQKACVNFCNYLSAKNIDVDLLVINKNGLLSKDVSGKINIIEANRSFLPFAITRKSSIHYGFAFYIKRVLYAIIAKFLGNKILLKWSLAKQPILDKVYDVAIAYAPSWKNKGLSVGNTELVLQKVNATKKVVFMHNDYEKSGLKEPYAYSQFKQFDKIFCVSKSCADAMAKSEPTLKDKVDYIYNICDTEDIKEKAKERVESLQGNFKIISVSRLSEEKGHLRALNVFKTLKEEGFDFCWHIVGDGPMRSQIEQKIDEYGLKDSVFMHGNKSNPYPYMKQADLLFLPSFHESFGLVLVESMILGVPILTTKTISAVEVVGDYGFVCENSENGIYNSLKTIITNKSILTEKQELLKNYKYNNNLIVEKIKTINN